jgi:hypothetical protein
MVKVVDRYADAFQQYRPCRWGFGLRLATVFMQRAAHCFQQGAACRRPARSLVRQIPQSGGTEQVGQQGGASGVERVDAIQINARLRIDAPAQTQ